MFVTERGFFAWMFLLQLYIAECNDKILIYFKARTCMHIPIYIIAIMYTFNKLLINILFFVSSVYIDFVRSVSSRL